jgi:predicted PhzF superfamily epimerase YddE/YHI9
VPSLLRNLIRTEHQHRKDANFVKVPFYHVDAFSDRVFSGNPAGVCPLEKWLDEPAMLAIAAENNLSETAFCVREGEQYGLRWFAPKSEVQLCGHATLATGLVVLNYLQPGATSVQFQTCSGALRVRKDGDFLAMDLPLIPARPCPMPPSYLTSGLSPTPRVVLESGKDLAERNYFVVYDNEDEVRSVKPDLPQLEKLHPAGVCITAPGKESDFVSRYFAPSYGIPEDPVTGSTHCTLAPYWSQRLGKKVLHARQVSQRGGALIVEPRGERVILRGKAAVYLTGELSL